MEKFFRETQEKQSSSGTRRREMVQCTLTLSGDKCEVGGGGRFKSSRRMENMGENIGCMEKLFRETQGKQSSSGTRRRKMVQCTLTLSGDKCEVGGGGEIQE